MSRVVEVLLSDGTEFKGDLNDALRRITDQFAPMSPLEVRTKFVALLYELFLQGGWCPPGSSDLIVGHEHVADFREGERPFEIRFNFTDSHEDPRAPRDRYFIARADSLEYVSSRLTQALCERDAVLLLGYTLVRPMGNEERKAVGAPVVPRRETMVYLEPMSMTVMKQGLINFEVRYRDDLDNAKADS